MCYYKLGGINTSIVFLIRSVCFVEALCHESKEHHRHGFFTSLCCSLFTSLCWSVVSDNHRGGGGGDQARYHHSTADHVDSAKNYRRFSFILGKFPIFFWSYFLLDSNISFYDLI